MNSIQRQNSAREKKWKRSEDDPLHVDARKEVNRKSDARALVCVKQQVDDARKWEDMADKVKLWYCLFKLSLLILFRIAELDARFADLWVREQEWPNLCLSQIYVQKGCYAYPRSCTEYCLRLLWMYISQHHRI